MTTYQSPISPGVSWYEASCGPRPRYQPLDGDRSCDVVIIGGGYTGLSAAYHLAQTGADVVLVEAHRLGDGASGRNGGQLSSGQRHSVLWLEERFGYTRAKALWNLAEEAKAHAVGLIGEHDIDCDLTFGHLTALHKARYYAGEAATVDALWTRYGYDKITMLVRPAMAAALGSEFYHGGSRDAGAGHLHPMKFLIGLANAAAAAGAHLFEDTAAINIEIGRRPKVKTLSGTLHAGRVLVACNGHIGALEPETARHVMPIRSYIAATEPLADDSGVLPGSECACDSRFVIRYFRKSADNRLLFGGREVYTGGPPENIAPHQRQQIVEVYPQLMDVAISHAWGGSVAVTLPRLPFVREVMPNVLSVAGFSGQGVALAPFAGKLVAEAFNGNRERLKLFEDLAMPAFPGGALLRQPLLTLAMAFYALRDRI
jgi:gamma-glutamylputrescine oxidase